MKCEKEVCTRKSVVRKGREEHHKANKITHKSEFVETLHPILCKCASALLSFLP